MKRFTLIVALALIVTMPLFAERVTPETARKAATTFLNNNGAKTNQLIDLSKAAGFPNLYIFSTEESFVILSADDCVKPVLGYSLTGSFTAEDMPENMIWWLQGYNDEIQSAVENKAKPTAETAMLWKVLVKGNSKAAKATVVVAPLIQTKWNQNKYYNSLCPAVPDGIDGHAYTGCVATAMAQIMKYWSYPAHGIGSHSYNWNGQTLSADFGATTYDWTNMADYYEYYYANGTDQDPAEVSNTEEEITAVATLMYHCGVSVEMNYGGQSTSSSAPNASVATALKNYFNYNSAIEYKLKSRTFTNPSSTTIYYTDDEWIAMVKTELNASRPLQYGGQDPNGSSGHAFVCDGYNSDNYFHFNWGWAGRYNGYFTINNLNTGANSSEAGAGNGTYTRDQEAVFGIEPASMIPAPTHLTYTLSGLQNVTLSWDAASGASSYNVYRDGNLIDNTTATSYSESAPFGTHDYHIRSVDANNQLSLLSNTVTVTIAYQTPIVDDLTATLSGDNVNLSWTAPEWCYPETPSATLTYGDGNMNSRTTPKYWAHRYLSNNLSQYASKAIYKVSFYVYETGSYTCSIYKGATEEPDSGGNIFWPSTLLTSKTIEVTSSSMWIDIDLDDLVVVDGEDDLWVIMYDPNNGNGRYDATFSTNTGSNNHGGYWWKWTSGDEQGYVLDESKAFLIKTCLTDGTYTYNLYQDGTAVAEDLSGTTYNANLNNNAANLFTVKTNYYAGETDASNKIGFAKGSASLNGWEMATNDQMTLTEGSTLTVSGDITNSNPNNLILENGAQLIHSSTGVKATVKKDIAPYTVDYNGWYFIASPVTETLTPSEENGFLNGTVGQGNNTYDLYYYYEPNHLWKNYETAPFNIVHKQGYLYANGETEGTTLQFAGTLTPSNNSVTINNLSHSSAVLNGFNLVGNPFVCNATVDKDFYVIDNTTNEVVLASQNAVIAPCEGVFVQASADNASVIFSKANAAKGNNAKDCFDIVVTEGSQLNQKNGPSTGSGTIVDRARVRLGEGLGMEKYSLDDLHTQISLWQDGQHYAVACLNGQDEMPLSFKTKENGTYTLSIEAEHLGLSYLHLIDNMTGNDVDLLATPNYIFEAKTTDYASRFRLVFNASPNLEPVEGPTHFAYISNGEIIITTDAYDASLQIVDMTGRVIVSRSGRIQCVPTTGMAPGVYVFRLINTDGVKTQKIVIE